MAPKQRRSALADGAFLKMIQAYTARAAIGPSSARMQGAPGVVAAAREFAARLKLGQFGTSDRRTFERRLDAATARLTARLPKRAASWGLSRKLLNIFLRDCFYSRYLCEAYCLDEATTFYEVPLDSITAKQIRAQAPELPRWTGVKHVDAEASRAYQEAAEQAARLTGLPRVHLDAYWWGARK